MGSRYFDFSQEYYSYTGFYVILERNYEKYIYGYYAPLFLFVVMSWLSFLISHQQVLCNDSLHSSIIREMFLN